MEHIPGASLQQHCNLISFSFLFRGEKNILKQLIQEIRLVYKELLIIAVGLIGYLILRFIGKW